MLLYSSVCFCIPPPQKAHTHAVLLNRAHYALHVSILYPHTRPFGLVRESFNSVFTTPIVRLMKEMYLGSVVLWRSGRNQRGQRQKYTLGIFGWRSIGLFNFIPPDLTCRFAGGICMISSPLFKYLKAVVLQHFHSCFVCVFREGLRAASSNASMPFWSLLCLRISYKSTVLPYHYCRIQMFENRCLLSRYKKSSVCVLYSLCGTIIDHQSRISTLATKNILMPRTLFDDAGVPYFSPSECYFSSVGYHVWAEHVLQVPWMVQYALESCVICRTRNLSLRCTKEQRSQGPGYAFVGGKKTRCLGACAPDLVRIAQGVLAAQLTSDSIEDPHKNCIWKYTLILYCGVYTIIVSTLSARMA